MAINVYATKEFENSEYVIYKYGIKVDKQGVRVKFNKNPLKLVIIDKESRALFKIACKIERLYK